MQRLAGTVSTWWPQILAAITTGVTNAGSEGTNRMIKADARCSFGYRNRANQRVRARATTTCRARGHLTTTPRPAQTPLTDRTARSSSMSRHGVSVVRARIGDSDGFRWEVA